MIRLIDIRLNAAHPELPLAEAVTYTGAPSTMLIRGVPGNCGKWCITSVYVAATFPDGSTSTRLAVQSANGVWVATLPATATSGRTASGVRIMADGEDENGEIVTGYILGVADFAVASLGVTPAPEPGATSWQMLYFDTVPGVLRKGDVAKIDGVLKLYNGTAWEPFADLSGCVPTSRTINGKALTDNVSLSGADIPVDATAGAQKIDAALAGKASTADATLTERGYSDWACVPQLPGGAQITWSEAARQGGAWVVNGAIIWEGGKDATSLNFLYDGVNYTATRSLIGYLLGPDASSNPNRDKPLASEAEAEALRQGKQDALTTQQLANIAAVSDALAFDATHSYAAGDPVVYNGTLYTFTAAHTGAWTGSDVSAVDIIARLANKLDKSGGAMDITYYHGPLTKDNQIVFAISAQGAYIAFKSGGHDISIGSDRITIDGQRLALTAPNSTAGNLAALDAQGNPTDSTISAANVALKGNIPYDLGTPIVIDMASSEVVEGETVNYGAATLANRTSNIVQVTAATALDELRITFPAETSGKVRDFGLRVEIGTGSAALTAPALVPIAPTGETIKIENNAAEIPALADGTATAKGVTLLYFSETAPGVFVVKGEQVEEVA